MAVSLSPLTVHICSATIPINYKHDSCELNTHSNSSLYCVINSFMYYTTYPRNPVYFSFWDARIKSIPTVSLLKFLDHTQLDTRARTLTHAHAREHTHTLARTHTLTIGLHLMRYQPVAEDDTYTTHKKHKRRTFMPSAGFKPAIPSINGLHTDALDRTATWIGKPSILVVCQVPILI
jgi:hypothetical protein